MKRFIILAGITLGSFAYAQPQSPIERAQALQRIADQRAETDVKQSIAELSKLYKVYPAKTITNLKALATQLDLRNDISAKTREALVNLVNREIAALQGANTTPTTPQVSIDPKIAGIKEKNLKALEAAQIEAKEISTTFDLIARYLDLGQTKEANGLIAGLAQKYPDNPIVIGMKTGGNTRDALTEWKYMRDDQSKRFIATLNNVQKSATPIIGDIEFDVKYWQTKVLPRTRNKELLGPEERALLTALESKIEKSLRGLPFEEAIQGLSTMIGKPIHLEKASIEDVGVDLRKPVDVPNNVDARTVLRSMLQSNGLTFIIRDKMIQVVTLEKARQNLVTRAYEVRDIVQNGATVFGAGSIVWGSYLDYQQTVQNANMIITAITAGIDPRVWKENGGPATITFHYTSMSLIVRAPAEVHSSLSGSFKR